MRLRPTLGRLLRERGPVLRVYVPVAAIWAVVYAGFVVAGQRFSTALAHTGHQFAPYDLLVDDPLRTSWEMHVQPPLWNLLIGLTARLSPLPDGLSFQLGMAAIGLAVALACARLALLCRLGRAAAVFVGVAAALLPETLGNTFTLAYELPSVLLLLVLANVIVEQRGRLTGGGLAVVAVVATSLAMIRALYHPLWLAVLLGTLAWGARRTASRRARTLTLAVPAVVVVTLLIKNVALVGVPSLTSWQGMNLLRSTQPAISAERLAELVRDGDIAATSALEPFRPYDVYAPLVEPCADHDSGEGSALLSEPYQRERDASVFTFEPVLVPNFNFRCFVPIYERAGSDAITLIRAEPDRWFHARIAAVRAWFTNYPGGSDPVGRWVELASAPDLDVLELDTAEWNDSFQAGLINRPVSPLAGGVALWLAVWSLVAGVRHLRRRPAHRLDVLAVTAGFLYFSTFVPSVLLELGEEARFRVGADALAYAAVGISVITTVRARVAGTERISD